MKFSELVSTARDTISVRRVFAEPIERDGVVVIPAARVGGGGGAGEGHDSRGQEGSGGGFGVGAHPVGVYTISGGTVRWVPAIDVNRILSTVGAVAIVFLWTRSRVKRARIKAGG